MSGHPVPLSPSEASVIADEAMDVAFAHMQRRARIETGDVDPGTVVRVKAEFKRYLLFAAGSDLAGDDRQPPPQP